jgi:hypothetical protein
LENTLLDGRSILSMVGEHASLKICINPSPTFLPASVDDGYWRRSVASRPTNKVRRRNNGQRASIKPGDSGSEPVSGDLPYCDFGPNAAIFTKNRKKRRIPASSTPFNVISSHVGTAA